MRVLNQKTHGVPAGSVYVGRPSKWGNPWDIRKGCTRQQAIELHAAWIITQPKLMAALGELRGKDLVCWCAPDDCHAETLMHLANPGWDKDQPPF